MVVGEVEKENYHFDINAVQTDGHTVSAKKLLRK